MYNDRFPCPRVFKERAYYLEEIDGIKFKRIDFAAVTKKIHQPVMNKVKVSGSNFFDFSDFSIFIQISIFY
jgi:hypothetical protein